DRSVTPRAGPGMRLLATMRSSARWSTRSASPDRRVMTTEPHGRVAPPMRVPLEVPMAPSETAAGSNWSGRYLKLVDHINAIVRLVLIIAMITIFGATLLQVIVRFLLTQFGIRTSVPWAE